MAYKIQGLDSDSFVSAKQRAEQRPHSGGQDKHSHKEIEDVTGTMSTEFGEVHGQKSDEKELGKEGSTQGLSQATLQNILAEIAALTNELQALQAKFQAGKNTIETKIGQAAIQSAIDAGNALEAKLREASKKKKEMGILNICAKVFEGLIMAVALITGQMELFMAMAIIMAMDFSGATNKLTNDIATGLKNAGMGSTAANILAAGIIMIAEIVLTAGTCIAGGAASAAAEGGEAASKAAIKAVIKEVVEQAVKEATESAAKSAAEDGSAAVSQAVTTAAKQAAETAAKEMSEQFGSVMVKDAMKSAVKEGVKEGLKQAAKDSEGAAQTAIRSAAKNSVKSIVKTVSEDAAENIGNATGKSASELSDDMKSTLKQAAKKIARQRTKSAMIMTASSAVGSTGLSADLAQLIVSVLPVSEKKKKTLEVVIESMIAVLTMIAAVMSGSGATGDSNIGNALAKGSEDAAESGARRVMQMIRNVMSTMINSSQKFALGASTLMGVGEGATQMSQAVLEFQLSRIESEMGTLQPDMDINVAISQAQSAMIEKDMKFVQQMYQEFPVIMSNINSIATEFAAAAKALMS